MILVTGATGTAGSEVVRALIERGRAVRVLARDPVRARDLFGPAVEVVSGDFDDALSVRAALVGAEQLFLSCADDPRRVAWESAAIDAAAASGVRRIVKLSSIGAEPGSPVAFWDWHGRVERHLRESAGRRRRAALELLHVQRARGRRSGGFRGHALRARGRRADRDDRPARRRRGRGRGPRRPPGTTGARTSSPARRRSPTPRSRRSCRRRPAATSRSSTSTTTTPAGS